MKHKASNCLRMSLPFFRLYTFLPPRMQKDYLKHIREEIVVYKALHELAHNILNGNIKLNKKEENLIKPYRKTLKDLCIASNKNCLKKRKRLIQRGAGIVRVVVPKLRQKIFSK